MMGSAVGTPTQNEMKAYVAVREAYERLSPLQRQEDGRLQQLSELFQKTLRRSELVAELLGLSEDKKMELGQAVLRAVLQKEERSRAATGNGGDYTKSFGGTKQDTQVENEYASLARGAQDGIDDLDAFPILRPVECNDPQELEKLRATGIWIRYLGAKGCYMWIHSLTRENTPLRPVAYMDNKEEINGATEESDISGGYPTCTLSRLPDMIKEIIDDQKRTPLLIDNSEDEKVAAFLSYEAALVDVSILAVGYQKSGVKATDLMESVRTRAVSAIKAGTMLVLRLGHLTSEHADFKGKLCTRNVFPAEIFQEGGKKLFSPPQKPRCNLMFRDEDKEANQYLVKPDGFRFCVVTSLPPTEIVAKLGETIPLGYCQPVYIISS